MMILIYRLFLLFRRIVSDRAIAPIYLERTAAFTAMVRLLAHRIVHANGEQFTTVRAIDLRRTGDRTRKAEFVVDEVVEEGH